MNITAKDIELFNNSELSELFNHKLTENGDLAHTSTGNILFDLFFQAEYWQKHLSKVKIGQSDIEKLLAMFIRDPRNGLGYRSLGRVLLAKSGVSAENVAKCGRFDDLWKTNTDTPEWIDYLIKEILDGNNLAKKWAPHYVGKNKDGKVGKSTLYAAKMRRILGLNKQQYNKLVKVDTVESKLSSHDNESIDFEKLPSMALLKYWARFANERNDGKYDFSTRFAEYLDDVKRGKKKMNFSTATVYDIYRNQCRIDPDVAFEQINKVSGNWIPVLDTSGSMWDKNDSIGKAMSVAHYLAKTSTYCPNQVVSFSSKPKLITLGECDNIDGFDNVNKNFSEYYGVYNPISKESLYGREIASMFTGDYTNTDFGAVMDLFGGLETEFPEYIVVLSDMEFDNCSGRTTNGVMDKWKELGIKTRLVWWNFNARSRTSTQSVRSDADGNLFLSGYNPTLLRFLDNSFNMASFMASILTEYSEKLGL